MLQAGKREEKINRAIILLSVFQKSVTFMFPQYKGKSCWFDYIFFAWSINNIFTTPIWVMIYTILQI